MRKTIFLFLFASLPFFSGVHAQSYKLLLGHPDRSANMDVLPGFKNPPQGYGEVPFYWWQGDTLTREHLTDHLDMLAIRGVSSIQINYCHSDKGGKSWGLTIPSKPAIFTDEWWSLFGWFMKEAKKRGMTVSLSDYTLGVGQEKCVDAMLKEYPELNGEELKEEQRQFNHQKAVWTLTRQPLSLMAFRIKKDKTLDDNSAKDLSAFIKNNTLEWNVPEGDWMIVNVYAEKKIPSLDPMNPKSGKEYVKHFFQMFEDHFPLESKGGLNFFFSDELDFKLRGFIWDDGFRKAFMDKKGYDLLPHLAALFNYVGDKTSKYRLDYNDVMVSLTEENYFKPVHKWHEDRGLIFGCDHSGRGTKVDEFGDYFRTHRWVQAAGCDQPDLSHDVIKNKVASSIAHLYNNPRTWLEGFYGSGWQTSSAMLLNALYTNYAQGQNLLSLHGLYYSTLGGWWEWAPPCNHFHEPYWQEMPHLLASMERLSYLLSQGYHSADVAVMYPVEPVVAGDGDGSVKCAFNIGRKLYSKGIDFDFIDYESLARTEIKDNKLNISGERYSVLVIPSMKTIRYASLKKALEFQKAGGLVLCVDTIPDYTDNGKMDAKAQSMTESLFHISSSDVVEYISNHIKLDFMTTADNPYIMHRKIGFRDIYAVYNVPKGTECYYRAKGSVELWDPWTGNVKELSATRTDSNGTFVSMPLEATEMQILAFDPSKQAEIAPVKKTETSIVQTLDDEWRIKVIPSLDNKWGDFSWPGTPEKIGPEIRSVRYSQYKFEGWNKSSYDDRDWDVSSVSYGNHFLQSGPLKNPLTEQDLLTGDIQKNWKPYAFSWRWGVEHDYGHQGFHGLKGEMYADFIRLGKIQITGTSMKRVEDAAGRHYYLYTNVIAPKDGDYLWASGIVKPADVYLNGKKMNMSNSTVHLTKGENSLCLHYVGPCTTYFVVKDPAKEGLIAEQTKAERPLCMRWNGDESLLPMDITNSRKNLFYRFATAPGLERLVFTAYGKDIKAWVNGNKVKCEMISKRENGAADYELQLDKSVEHASVAALQMTATNANMLQGAVFPNPIRQYCGEGMMNLGDWADYEGLKYYSGGMAYMKNFNVEKLNAESEYILNLGDVVSTAEVWINHKRVGLRMAAPWTFDITSYIEKGKNEVTVVVYNTAYNQYLSVPTQYNGEQKSGILGPVVINEIK